MTTWTGVTVDDFGWEGLLIITQDSIAQDISSYTTRQFILRKPSGEVVTVTASFKTDGTDGKLSYVFPTGVIDEAGRWFVQARIAKTGVELTGAALDFQVAGRLG